MEFHWPSYHYVGPGTHLESKDANGQTCGLSNLEMKHVGELTIIGLLVKSPFCCLSRSSLYLNTLVFCSSYALDYSGVKKITDEGDLYCASCLSSIHSICHLGSSPSTQLHRYFTSRISCTLNSVSTFNRTRLCLTTSGDITPNPGPPIMSFTTKFNRRTLQHQSHYHSDCSKTSSLFCNQFQC